jgi:hypothetical protein
MGGDRLVNVNVFPSVAVASGGTYTTPALPMHRYKEISLIVKVYAASGTPDVKIEYAVSSDGTNFGAFTDNTALVASSNAFATPKGITAAPLPNFLAPYVKLKITGIGGNPAGTIVDGVFVGREKT